LLGTGHFLLETGRSRHERGGPSRFIWCSFLEPFARSWSHFVGIFRLKLTQSSKIDLTEVRRALRGQFAKSLLRGGRERDEKVDDLGMNEETVLSHTSEINLKPQAPFRGSGLRRWSTCSPPFASGLALLFVHRRLTLSIHRRLALLVHRQLTLSVHR
jgi:hypothetical protein